jgi:hypothetical protein
MVHNVTLGTSSSAHTYGSVVSVKLNSLFDPVSTSHQPLFFDQLKLLYQRYVVRHTRVVLTFMPLDATTIYEFTTLLLPPATTSLLSGITTDTAMEKPGMKSVKLQGNGANSAGRIEWDISLEALTGLTRAQYSANVEEYGALCTVAPVRVPVLEAAVANLSASSAQNARGTIEIEYDAELYDRAIPGQS